MATVTAPTSMDMEVPEKTRSSLAAFGSWLGVTVSGALLALSIIGVVLTLILGVQWYNEPFLGVFTSHVLVVSSTGPISGDNWTGLTAGLRTNDKILAVNSVSFEGVADPGPLFNDTVAALHIGDTVSVKVFRATTTITSDATCPGAVSAFGGATCVYSVPLQHVPLADFLLEFGIGFVVATVLLGIALLLWLVRRRQPAAQLVTVICAAMAFVVVGRFELLATFRTGLPWLLAMCVVSGGLLQMALTFPYEFVFVRRMPALRALPLILTVGGFLVTAGIYLGENAQGSDNATLLATGFTAFATAVLLLALMVRHRGSSSPVLRDQSAIVLVGAAVAGAPTVLWVVTVLVERFASQYGMLVTGISFPSVYIVPSLVIFPIALTYSILQYRFLDTDRIISEGLIYSALGALLILAYLVVTGAAFYITNGVLQANNPVLIAITLFVIALAFAPMRLRLERSIDEAFFKQRRGFETRLEHFARALTQSVELADAVQRVKQELDETVLPKYLFAFLRNSATGEYEAFTGTPGIGETDIRFRPDSPLIHLLNTEQPILYITNSQMLLPELISERARLAVLNTPVIARLQSGNRLNGFIALGPRADVGAYSYEDLRFIQGVVEQAASAFERAQIVIEAQRSARELRVLAQVSASLNIVMDFDTLLEFIYTQVDKVISGPNFYIVLRDEQGDELSYAFYQEGGERLFEREGYRWRMGHDLMSEVVRTGQPLNTDNYPQEMLRRDPRIHIENTELHAWMGVPLNAGQSTALGCMVIATTDSAITYSEDQVRIFWNIADLAATAIYKTRLFSQTEERARQMKVLNDISSRLASEFENLDVLLQVITESAVEILRGEAGSLLLREESSGDLIFQLAVGGSGQELVGSRIPAGSGIAGTVVQTGRHMIVNDTQRDTRWFGEVNREKAGTRKFSTRAILAVPLTTRAGVIGVLEVINKLDGTQFVEDDVNLLTAFAGQAAVAIENARLFQMTDQALATRVQQLDNMQRIDQELNRTLDLQRVVELTIDNAIRESSADAGALALVQGEPPSFEIVGSIGYMENILAEGGIYPITLGILGKVYRTGQASLITGEEMAGDRDYIETLPAAKGQLAVPLFTGTAVSAVLLLEALHDEAFTMVTASFIQGLAEHANTAITNAQLFERLGEANQARSKFVGFVAHELKNPMSSIKGYAEVLLGGMTGTLNEQQQNFIAVIRRNVVRMQQLVDDLRDLTAQETGNLTLKRSPVSFTNVILETLRPQQRAIDEKEQAVALNYPENLPLVWGDELRLIQVMTNFVSNANKYTPTGGTITIMAEHVPNEWDPTGPAEVVHCAVTDTGIGMNEEDLKKLFTPYWRSENPRAQEQPGTGLGMTLTRGLIEAHNGKIWVESTMDVGTTFHVTVPLSSEFEKVTSDSRQL